jgi:hypothetical protein
MIVQIKLHEQQISRIVEMTKILYQDIIIDVYYDEKDSIFLIQQKDNNNNRIHWYELLINHLVPGIYMFGLEEFCLNIECWLENKQSTHLVDIVYERFEQHIKRIIEKT